MNVPATEEQIRALAYRLWEEAGSPEGRAEDFWVQAQEQLAGETGPESGGESVGSLSQTESSEPVETTAPSKS